LALAASFGSDSLFDPHFVIVSTPTVRLEGGFAYAAAGQRQLVRTLPLDYLDSIDVALDRPGIAWHDSPPVEHPQFGMCVCLWRRD
jgi:hypothetical protein